MANMEEAARKVLLNTPRGPLTPQFLCIDDYDFADYMLDQFSSSPVILL